MENGLDFNSKLFSASGYIGRRDFIVNNLYILLILSFFWCFSPLVIIMPKSTISIILAVFFLLGCIIGSISIIPNVIKRLNDINGKVDIKINIIYILGIFLALFAIFANENFIFLHFALIIFLWIKRGKITSNLPKDIKYNFNWGAFLGTWIWGLLNKCYTPLWMLLLWVTPLGFPFSLICGFKGNEWALKNQNWESESKFRKTQDKQSTFFIVLNFIVVPMLMYILMVVYVFLAITNKESSTETAISKLENTMVELGSTLFDKYEITETENKFYVSPSSWNFISYDEKRKILKHAATIASIEKSKKNSSYGRSSARKELSKTKIYNIKNNEILAEYVEPDYYDDENLIKIMAKDLKRYKIRNIANY